jgi:hypothetical protein
MPPDETSYLLVEIGFTELVDGVDSGKCYRLVTEEVTPIFAAT